MIKRQDGTIYFGYTADLRRWMKEHKVPEEDLVYYEAYKAKEDASARERQLKKYQSAWGQLKKRTEKSRI